MSQENHNITCPHCGQVFGINNVEYLMLAQQVRGQEFDKDVDRIRKELQAQYERDVKIAVQDALSDARDNEAALRTRLSVLETQHTAAMAEQKISFEAQLRAKDEEVKFYRDFKARQSTKSIGESLEQYCLDEFDKMRHIAFPHDYFDKDNAISESGSKGDFIYRARTPDGGIIVSAMLEMKNEADKDATKTGRKHKNKEFFAELDKDRREKGCEYAILVSLLEPDSDVYNAGIVLVPEYEKMFVIRPQFLLSMLGLIRYFGSNVADIVLEANERKQADASMLKFDEELRSLGGVISNNSRLAGAKVDAAIRDIDGVIAKLERAKSALTLAGRRMSTINELGGELNVESLSAGIPGLAAILKEETADRKG